MGPLPLMLAVALSAVYLWSTPLAGDLAAQTARGQLFLRSGFVSWWAGWYGGVGTSTYSLVSPALLGLLGPVLLGALSIVATPLAAAPLLRRTLRPALGGLVLSLTAAADVAVGRVTFAAGVVVALLAASAAARDWRWTCCGLALLATFTSPVAGLLLLVVSAGIAVSQRQTSVWAWCAVACLAALAVLWWLSGGQSAGFEPFSVIDLVPPLVAAVAVALMPVGRTMRAVGAATVVALLAAFLVHSPVGQNITRLVLLGGAPVVAAQARLRAGSWPGSSLPRPRSRPSTSVHDARPVIVGQHRSATLSPGCAASSCRSRCSRTIGSRSSTRRRTGRRRGYCPP